MRVLLISANQERSPDPVAPLGLCYVATATAAAGHDVERARSLLPARRRGRRRRRGGRAAPRRDRHLAAQRRQLRLPRHRVVPAALPPRRRRLPAPRATRRSCSAARPSPRCRRYYLPTLGVPYGVVGEGEATFPALLDRLAARGADRRPRRPRLARRRARPRVNPPAWLPAIDGVRADRRWMDVARSTTSAAAWRTCRPSAAATTSAPSAPIP